MKRLLLLLVCLSTPLLADSQSDYETGFAAFRNEDLVTALQYLGQASDQGHVRAQVLLAYILDKAEENEQALALYRKAAATGDAEAQMGLAMMLAAGEGVEVDNASAFSLLLKSADQGHVPAMLQLYQALDKGTMGQRVDRAEARNWLEKAAAAGDAEAKKLLATDHKPSTAGE
ncbi:tetratricopeptide repeat protein [Sedimenticola hydrogenitrophicus]|uniref:tetratricopeptide repeat protein n=1 Tax=Sedimenticola hydrogenitrophicus TaxID=2967975 RepID=UPI0023AEFC0E|nr:tetratricopeptide repeat protein [Sedimenticola hydrogenitrophicus]